MYPFVVTIIYICGIIASLDAVMTSRTSQGATAWAIALVCFPFIALPAYLVFGRNKFEGSIQAYAERKDEIDALKDNFEDQLQPWLAPSGSRQDMERAMRQLAGMRMTRGNRVTLLVNGEATFDSILAGIAEARNYVLVQFYMVHDDGLGRRLQQALIERAGAGVRVYLLYDEVGSLGLPPAYTKPLRDAGVEVSAFQSTRGVSNRFQLNFRNHRKMVVVDGRSGWIGGHNVGDEYLGLNPKLSPWRDTHIKLQGPVVIQLQAVILTDWYWATRKLPDLSWKPQPAADSDVKAMIMPFSPSTRLEAAGLFFVAALQSARRRIWLSAPYFVPDEAVMKALELAALRGVDIRILIPGKADHLPVYLAGFYYIDQLRGLGIRFYAYRPGFLHEKVMLIDDDISSVGTANYDNRSFRLNFEVTALIQDQAFAADMEHMFERDFAHAECVDYGQLDQKPIWWWAGVRFCRLASPLL